MTHDGSVDSPHYPGISMAPSRLDSPPPSAVVEVAFGTQSRPGSRDAVNRDHYLVLRTGRHQETLLTSLPIDEVPRRFEEFGYGMAIADGAGTAGEAASRLALSTLVHLAVYFGKWNVRVDEPVAEEVMDRAARFYRSIDATLLEATYDSSRDLQTTLTAVYTAGSELFFAHVGHSRAYMFRDGELMRLTRDHGPDCDGAGTETVADGPRLVRRPVTEKLGGHGTGPPRIDVARCGLLDRDIILLCTHGLTSVVEEVRIRDTLRSHDTPNDCCRALIALVDASNGEDDATVVMAQYRIRA